MMKMTEQWITQAAAALQQVGIVVKKEEKDRPVAYFFPKPFKGYISSFAATVVQSGLLPTLDIYEKEDSAAEASRHLLPLAIAELLCRMRVVGRNEGQRLSEYWEQAAQDQKKEFQKKVEQALVALKLAIRMYKAVKPEDCPPGTAGCSHAGQTQVREPEEERMQQAPRAWNGPANCHANVGWLYYREYYRDYEVNRRTVMKYTVRRGGLDIEETINKHEYLLKYHRNPFLFSSKLDEMLRDNQQLSGILAEAGLASLTFRTLYPGMIIGLGLSHGTPVDGDLKCGFQFDYATGLPIIPGSSVKGVLRSVFPDPDGQADERNMQKAQYIASLLRDQQIELTEEELFCTVQKLAKQIFEHNDRSQQGTDIFMDALLTGPESGKFMADDYLTPHGDEYKDPVPIQFLKVLPNIEFTFFFKLTAFKIGEKEVDKLDLFRSILEDVGIGAKTNVGYGHLELKK